MTFDYHPIGMFARMSPDHCKAGVHNGRMGFSQCSNKPTRDGYCGTHHPDAEAKRNAKRNARYEAHRAKRDLRYEIEAAEEAVVETALKLKIFTDGPEARRLQKAVERLKRLREKAGPQ